MADEYIQAEGKIFTNDYPRKLVRQMANSFADDKNLTEVEVNVAVWERTSRNKNKRGEYTNYLFTRIEMPREKKVDKEEAKQVAETVATSEANDDIPF
jgi:hypothetical protein